MGKSTAGPSSPYSRSRPAFGSISWRAYAQLVRLPNVFTAAADICLGWLVALATGTTGSTWPRFALLLGSSACLYSAGMVWNDFFDVEQDRRERPFRPLPSGRIDLRSAGSLGATLLILGGALSGLAGVSSAGYRWESPALAFGLILAILLYDGLLKRTVLGPVGMGACRFLNVLLGLSVAEVNLPWGHGVLPALVVGCYIIGVTWFARTEARPSNRTSLAGAAGTMLVALILALALPALVESSATSFLFPYLLLALGFWVGIPVSRALRQPTPALVQPAVKQAVLGLVILDAALASALAGNVGLLILVLLVPVLYLGRWIYST